MVSSCGVSLAKDTFEDVLLRVSAREAIKERRIEKFYLCLVHGVPQKKEDTLFSQLFEEKKVDKAVFGHIHGNTFIYFLFISKNCF